MLSKFCLICYNKVSSELGDNTSNADIERKNVWLNPTPTENPEVTLLKRFFKLLGRLLNENANLAVRGKCIDGETMQFLFDQVIDAGMLACGDCFKMVESFCELYQEVKSLELILNWKLGLLKDIMFSAERDPSRMKMFREGAKLIKFEDISADEIIDLIIDCKGDLVKKCTRKLNKSFPRVTLDKIKFIPEEGKPNNLSQFGLDSSTVTKTTEPSNLSTKKCILFKIRDVVETVGTENPDNNRTDSTVAVGPISSNADCKTEIDASHLNWTEDNDDNDNYDADNYLDSLEPDGSRPTEEEGQRQHLMQAPNPTVSDTAAPSSVSVTAGENQHNLECTFCGIEFESRRGLNMHLAKAHPDTGKHLQLINDVHGGVSRFKCEKCGKLFTQKSALTLHQRTTAGCGGNAPKYGCSLCDKAYSRSFMLNQHMKSVHLKDTHGAPRSNSVRRQIRLDTDIPGKCDLCGKQFSNGGSLFQHHQAMHLGLRFKCDNCSKGFTQQSALRMHQRTTAGCGGNAPKYKCPICEKAYTRPGTLALHMKSVHEKAKDHLCCQCGKGFPTLSELKRHQAVHSDVRGHLCDVCGKGFKFQSQLSSHKKDHHHHRKEIDVASEESSSRLQLRSIHRCAKCSKTFSTSLNLEEHERSHDDNLEDENEIQDDDDDDGGCSEGKEPLSDVDDLEYFSVKKEDPLVDPDSSQVASIIPPAAAEEKDETSNQPVVLECVGADASDALNNEESVPSDAAESSSEDDIEDEKKTKADRQVGRRRRRYSTNPTKSIINPETGKHGCPLCAQEYSLRRSYLRHFRSVHTDTGFQCRQCSKTFQRRNLLRSHQRFSKSCGDTPLHPMSKCPTCAKQFSSPNDMKVHIKFVHHKIRNHPCNHCGKRFYKPSLLKKHANTVHAVKPEHLCNLCGNMFPSKRALNSHSIKYHNNKREQEEDPTAVIISQLESANRKNNDSGGCRPGTSQTKEGKEIISYIPPIKIFPSSDESASKIGEKAQSNCVDPLTGKLQCLLCPNKTFSIAKSLKNHHEAVHLQIRYKCSLCDDNAKLFKFRSQYHAHCQKLHLSRSFKCEECGKVFPTSRPLADHLRRFHSRTSQRAKPTGGTFNCTICEKKFKGRGLFRRHYKTVHLKLHPNNKLTKCDLCGKEFNTVTGYQLHHKSVHLGLSFQCEKCHKHFTQKSGLRLHRETSIGCGGNAPKYKCSTCGKYLQTTTKLKLHVKSVHEKAKDHLCSECGKGFPTLSELKRHQAVHSDLKGHLCDLCGKGFKWKTQLVSHRAKEHKQSSKNDVGEEEGSSNDAVA